MIDKNSPIPIYYQLKQYILKLIETGELQPGDAIPSEREFGERFGISRMTVRQAITNLANERVLYRVKGKGTFVMAPKLEQSLQGLTSFTEDMKARGMKASSKLLSFGIISADENLAKELDIKENDEVYEIKRIRLAEEIPMALERTYISAHIVPTLTEEIVQNSLYQYIENELHLRIASGMQKIEASLANAEELRHLQISSDTPILLMERKTHLEDDTVFEIVKSSYRADRYKFMTNLKRY
ncbi:GntR family transcriptional regulator [Virgibacillus soli]|uniref:GntR family transcriptional regulator n=1 Tax=Lederbergia galactosidilytica TaxID=217031 RepID=UPI000713745E|nr:GntR family transcriptional regulator [Lederbergia galactosidilytica]KRG14344.1 GntR family transcriptional regulator [Virgibacillus soli]MBP1914452.1 GntR family transcriptional regulator [Lederbergia galactosidilytica]